MLKYFCVLFACYWAIEARTICYEPAQHYGCFTDEYPFSGTLERPIAVLPESPDKIAVKYTLFNPRAPNGQVITFSDVPTNQNYNPLWKTKFIVHGYLHHGSKPWLLNMKDAFLRVEPMNVITVDWSKGNGPFYTQSTANTQVVGADIARLINTMISTRGAKAADFHIIGHSLGSHIAGYAGSRVTGLGRITGLDPAGPYFEFTPTQVRLDPSDAVFVDVIHSDGAATLELGLGLFQSVGHVDFFPNGGRDQPNCPKTADKILNAIFGLVQLNIDAIEDTTVCSHMAAVFFFIDSISQNCQFKAYECGSEAEFNAGKCLKCTGRSCNRMGYWAVPNALSTQRVNLYLDTQPPLGSTSYCKQNFGFTLTSAKNTNQNQARGIFRVQIETASGKSALEVLDNDSTFKAGGVDSRMVSLNSRIAGEATQIFVSYTRTSNILISWMYDSQWAFSSIELFNADSQTTTKFCQSTTVIASGQTVAFYKC